MIDWIFVARTRKYLNIPIPLIDKLLIVVPDFRAGREIISNLVEFFPEWKAINPVTFGANRVNT